MTDQESYGPPLAALPLEQAMRELLPVEMWEELARAKEARKGLPKRPRPFDMTPPEWRVAKANYDAVIRGMSPLPNPDQVWREMLVKLHSMLESGELTAFGQEDPPFGQWQAIPAHAWRRLRITNTRKAEAKVDENKVHDIHILPPGADDHMPTGTPGRPKKGIEIIRAEFQRRVDSSEIAKSLAAEARALQAWYRETYPRRDCPTTKTIENNIRFEYKAKKTGLA